MDVTAVVTAIESVSGSVTTVGLAILGVLAIVAGISLMRRVVR